MSVTPKIIFSYLVDGVSIDVSFETSDSAKLLKELKAFQEILKKATVEVEQTVQQITLDL